MSQDILKITFELDIPKSSRALCAIDMKLISRKRLAELADLPEYNIDTSDIAELSEAFFREAKLRQPNPMTRAPETPTGRDEPQP